MKRSDITTSYSSPERGSVKVETAFLVVFLALIAVPSLSFLGHSAAEKLCEPVPNEMSRDSGGLQDNQVVYRRDDNKCGYSTTEHSSSGSSGGNGNTWTVGTVGLGGQGGSGWGFAG